MDPDVIAWVRLVHIVLAAFWVGGDVYFFLLIAPNFRHMGAAAETFSFTLLRRGGFGRILLPIAITTVLAGAYLYYSLGYHRDPLRDAASVTLTIGATLAVLALLAGIFYFTPKERELVRIARAAPASGPTLEQSARMRRIGAAMDKPSKAVVTALALAFILMVARTVV